jgi:hypothetical protein
MYCENKNHLLDLYFLEGNENEHSEIREHVENCKECRDYLGTIKRTMSILDEIPEQEPSINLFEKIAEEISVSIPKPLQQKSDIQLVPILQIAFGEIFLFSLIYFLKIQLTLLPLWKSIQDHWFVQSLGSAGISVILVLIAGSFITLSLAPVLLFESKGRKNFN